MMRQVAKIVLIGMLLTSSAASDRASACGDVSLGQTQADNANPRVSHEGPAAPPVDAAATQPATSPAGPAFEDLVLLCRNARRAFRSRVLGLPERAAGYHPLGLRGERGIIHLTLRSRGVLLAEAESEEMDIVDASVAAGSLLGAAALERKAADGFGARLDDGGDRLGIELEWLGPCEYLKMAYYGEGGTWTDALLHAFEPAAEGIGVEFRGKRGWTRPSEVVSMNYSPDLALAAAEKRVGLRHMHKIRQAARVRYYRFQAYHAWQPTARAAPVRLFRGERLVPPIDVRDPSAARDRLDRAIDRLGAYLAYRQNQGGGFSHEYAPAADRYIRGNSARVQLRALAGLATYAAWSNRPEAIAGAEKGIEAFRQYLQPVGVREGPAEGASEPRPAGLVLALPGHGGHLEISARLLSAMLRLGEARPVGADAARPYGAERDGLVRALLACQSGEGGLAMACEGGESSGTGPGRQISSDADAGVALLALAEVCAGPPSPADAAGGLSTTRPAIEQVERALSRAASYYRLLDDRNLSPGAAASLARAFALHYERVNDARLSDFVFGVADRLAELQLGPAVCLDPELYGAVNVRRPGLIGADTAVYLAALADALVLAERVGDPARADRYRRAVASAARFILQLQISETGCYYIRSPRDALGGIRSSPWNHRIRADHCGNALVALIRARTALFGARR